MPIPSAVLDPGIRKYAARYGLDGLEVQKDEFGWKFRSGNRVHHSPWVRISELAERDQYERIDAEVRHACFVVGYAHDAAKRRRAFRTKQRNIPARTFR